MISPTVGRVVWFHPGSGDRIMRYPDQPLAAHIAHVWSDTNVNLMVIDADGACCSRTSIFLMQDGGRPVSSGEAYCEWMPYQKGQAARTEAAEAAVRSQTSVE